MRRTAAEQLAEVDRACREFIHDLGDALTSGWPGRALCVLRIHHFSVAHPHYCGRCGRYYALK